MESTEPKENSINESTLLLELRKKSFIEKDVNINELISTSESTFYK